MNRYNIYEADSGGYYGVWRGNTEEEALDSMLREAGYEPGTSDFEYHRDGAWSIELLEEPDEEV